MRKCFFSRRTIVGMLLWELILVQVCYVSGSPTELDQTPLPQRCPPSDFVCELIMLHTTGVLTQSRIENLTTSIDNTWRQAVALDLEVNSLTQTVGNEVRDTQNLKNEISYVDQRARESERKITCGR